MTSALPLGDGGPSGAVVVLAVVAALVVVPLVLGLALRLRDRRGGPGTDEDPQRHGRDPGGAPFFLSGSWGRNARGDQLTRQAWGVAIVLAAVLAVAGVLVALMG